MRRSGTADEVASAVLFLSSKEATHTTGPVIEVTGEFPQAATTLKSPAAASGSWTLRVVQ